MKLRDGREVVTDRVIDGALYNLYSCPGPDGREAHIDHRSTTNPMGRYVEAEHFHSLLSLDVDPGVTPMFVTCPDHDRTAESRGYRVDVGATAMSTASDPVCRCATCVCANRVHPKAVDGTCWLCANAYHRARRRTGR